MTWTPATQADYLRDLAAAYLAEYGDTSDPEPCSPEGIYARGRCACGRSVPVFELVDASLVPEHPSDYACGACREGYIRAGVIGSAEWARRMGAPTELLAKLAEKDGSVRGE